MSIGSRGGSVAPDTGRETSDTAAFTAMVAAELPAVTARSEMRRRALAVRSAGFHDRLATVDHADTTVERIEARTRVEAAMARLRPLDREVLRLSAWEQLTPTDIAAVLDCSVTAAKVRLHRARTRFAAALDQLAATTHAPSPATTREVTS